MLDIEVVPAAELPPDTRDEILHLCNAAYGEDLSDLFATFDAPTHVLGRVDGMLVSHVMWVTRWLQAGTGPLIETAYIEFVATLPEAQRRGHATRIMQRVAHEIAGRYALGALCPATSPIYERLGWRFWRGPLAIRMPDGRLEPTPEEEVMILELPGGPPLPLDAPLSAEWRPGELW